jgi:PIN domain nuclease of toxin-antitoxin system
MSLTELIPLVENLSQPDQVALFKHLSTEIPNPDLQAIFSADEYPIVLPYDSFEAAEILTQAIREDKITLVSADHAFGAYPVKRLW